MSSRRREPQEEGEEAIIKVFRRTFTVKPTKVFRRTCTPVVADPAAPPSISSAALRSAVPMLHPAALYSALRGDAVSGDPLTLGLGLPSFERRPAALARCMTRSRTQPPRFPLLSSGAGPWRTPCGVTGLIENSAQNSHRLAKESGAARTASQHDETHAASAAAPRSSPAARRSARSMSFHCSKSRERAPNVHVTLSHDPLLSHTFGVGMRGSARGGTGTGASGASGAAGAPSARGGGGGECDAPLRDASPFGERERERERERARLCFSTASRRLCAMPAFWSVA